MSQENVEIVRSLQPGPDVDLVALFRDDAAASGWIDTVSPFFHEDCEIVVPTLVAGESVGFVGLVGLRAAWLDWLEPWESYRVEIEDVIDSGDEVVVLPRDYGRRTGMAAEVGLMGAAVWTVRDGKVARVVFHFNRSEALEAAGVSE